MNIQLDWYAFSMTSAILVGSITVGLALYSTLFHVISHVSRVKPTTLFSSFERNCRRPLKYAIPLLLLNFGLPFLNAPSAVIYFLDHAFHILFIAVLSWMIISLVPVAEDVVLSRYNITERDNLGARKIHTQIQVIRKILTAVLTVLAIGYILMRFDQFRRLGAGILASAGLASLIVGLAAQKIFANFLAGIEIAFTQPIRLDDVVVVENEWGRISEITLTYVVVKIWDERDLILPISYFIEKPFQNWTRTSSNMLGTVTMYIDFSVPVDDVRMELDRIVKSSDKWDRRVCSLQVTNMSEHAMELRALVSAYDSSSIWDLRCDVRERLIGFLQKHHPGAFSQIRLNLQDPAGHGQVDDTRI